MRTIIVTGHARSGTSLTASVLHRLGVNMGQKRKWRKADEANEAGYFENSQFVEANQQILEEGFIPSLQSIVKANESELWGAKDPRFLDTIQYWDKYLTNPMFIICTRAKKAITESVCHRDSGKYGPKKLPTPTLREVNEYYDRVGVLDNYPKIWVRFEDYFKDNKQIDRIADFVGVPRKELDLADPKLRHF